jgi:hypothetical protein
VTTVPVWGYSIEVEREKKVEDRSNDAISY